MNHKEAFCLMEYRDTDGNDEIIWNSRDGVTPFIVESKQGLESRHANWTNDKCVPHHIPEIGDRIFVDITEELARLYASRFVESFWGDPTFQIEYVKGRTKEEVIENQKKIYLDQPGAPALIEVDEKIRNQFKMGLGGCAICNGCLPSGEECQACGRINGKEYEC